MIRVTAPDRYSLLLRHLAEQFFADSEQKEYVLEARVDENKAFVTVNGVQACVPIAFSHLTSHQGTKLALGKAFAQAAQALSCPLPAYGLLTGVRPVKLALHYQEQFADTALSRFCEDYLLEEEKAKTLLQLAQTEKEVKEKLVKKDILLYLSIPFCPSRCSYCSFISSSAPKHLEAIPQYASLLLEELKKLSSLCGRHGLRVRGVYMGGGTPGILTASQLHEIFSLIKSRFPVEDCEFTCELGRPDTVTEEKLAVLRALGVGRISINTQSTNDRVLSAIGRTHSAQDFFRAFQLAKAYSFDSLNVDLIAGLPGEETESFCQSVEDVLSLSPENVTIHSFCLKKSASTRHFALPPREKAKQMLSHSHRRCIKEGYLPYYLYRQKNAAGALENTGYAKPGKACLYNIAMMEDLLPVFAAGAGGITKLPGKNKSDKIHRLAEFKYPFEYLKDPQKVETNLRCLDAMLTDYYRE